MGFSRIALVGMVTVSSFAAPPQPPQNPPPTPREAGGDTRAQQQLAPGSPEWAARAYLESVRKEGFVAVADFLHPDELTRFKSMLMPLFAAELEKGSRALMNATFGRDAGMEAVRLADPTDFLRRFARVMSVRIPDQPTGYDRLWVLGTVEEGAHIHVLVRLSSATGRTARERLEVLSLVPFAGEWKLLLDPKIEAVIDDMAQQEQGERAVPRLLPSPQAPEPAAPPPRDEKTTKVEPVTQGRR